MVRHEEPSELLRQNRLIRASKFPPILCWERLLFALHGINRGVSLFGVRHFKGTPHYDGMGVS